MDSLQKVSKEIIRLLGLTCSPIAITFVDKCPKGTKRSEKPVEACALWGKAREGPICVPPEDHSPCWMGVYAMGYELTQELQNQKKREATGMAKFQIMTPHAFEKFLSRVPSLEKKNAKFVVYQTLESAEKYPDVILITCKPEQAQLLTDSIAYESGEATPVLTNQPGCAIVPAVANQNRVVLSLGCGGSRKFFLIKPEEILLGMPGSMIEGAIRAMKQNALGNKRLTKYMGWK